MRILFLNYEYPPLGGGAANATREILRAYSTRSNLIVDLVTTAADNREHTETLSDNVRIHYVAINKDRARLTHQSARDLIAYTWYGLRRARALARTHHYDIAHAFFGVPCGWMARHISRIPYIVSLRGADVPGFSDRYEHVYPFLAPIIRHVWRGAAAVVANSAQLRDLARETAPQQRIDIIYNGVDTTYFSPRTEPLTPTPVRILIAARLMRRKGIRYALDAFEQLCNATERAVELTIAGGDGDAAQALRAQAAKLDARTHIRFVGHLDREALRDAYRNAHIFVLPSLNEGMSNNMLEALASGLPVIITRTGGSEIVTDGREGIIVDRANANAIYKAMLRLVEDDALRDAMAHAARQRAEKLSWTAVADAYEKLYYDIANRRR